MSRNKKDRENKTYLSAPKTSATMSIKGNKYLVKNYYIEEKNIHGAIIEIAEKEAYEEMQEKKKIKGGLQRNSLRAEKKYDKIEASEKIALVREVKDGT